MSDTSAESGTLTPETVREVAHIAQIELTDQEAETLAADLTAVLANLGKVSEIDNEGIPETSRPIPLSNQTRADEVADQLTLEQALQNAPEAQDDMFRVGSILGEAH